MKKLTLLFILFCFFNNLFGQVQSCQDKFIAQEFDKNRENGVFDYNDKWINGSTIKVKFLGGSDFVKSKIVKYSRYWEKYANITFKFIDFGSADILISFLDDGSWSYVGKASKKIASENRASMNFGWFTDTTKEIVFKRTILHEFGHALGLHHEHTNPKNNIKWNKPVVYNYYSNKGWTPEKVRSNLFPKYGETLSNSKYDKYSIMHYHIPKEHTLDGYSVGWNSELSNGDRNIISEMYPKPTTKKVTSTEISNTKPATGQILDVQMEHGVYRLDKNNTNTLGTELSISFNINNAKSKKSSIVAYFYHANGRKLINNEAINYRTDIGQVGALKEFSPTYEESTYDGLKIFIPYWTFDLGNGEFPLKFMFNLRSEDKTLVTSGYYQITYLKGKIVNELKSNAIMTGVNIGVLPIFVIKNAEEEECTTCLLFVNSKYQPILTQENQHFKICQNFTPKNFTEIYGVHPDDNKISLSLDINDIPMNKSELNSGKIYYAVALYSEGTEIIREATWTPIEFQFE
ncbi:hypothetical protein FEE95_03075 [Maribacter algarum]|uniref:Peptidase metallopeptidase domain-containing protein n=1 Tax=Maribacter algarum (ex Zhang et al. 2020) TaxID=2578118 RepID=A0A5S3PU34_9FLAO|nr:M12 family metallopeptidase [Maribacter algarum]TMM58428.1 hypothetical protein FEE95_03075 [Maribacter algarum]